MGFLLEKEKKSSPESFFAVLFNKTKVKSVQTNQVELAELGASFGEAALTYCHRS